MYKIILLLFISTILLFSRPIKFKEEKYISALNTSVYKYGILNIDSDILEVTYNNESKSLVFTKDNIIEKSAKERKILKYEDNLELTLFSKIINSIYKNKHEDLVEYFHIKKDNSFTTLIPNEYISNVINKIEYKKIDMKLVFLKIYFTNNDWINIVED